jgi:hypothetical protein
MDMGTVVVAEVHMHFRGKGNVEMDNFTGKWGPI